jgi:hypothetical protein
MLMYEESQRLESVTIDREKGHHCFGFRLTLLEIPVILTVQTSGKDQMIGDVKECSYDRNLESAR